MARLFALVSLVLFLSASLSMPTFANTVAPEEAQPLAFAATTALSPVADAYADSIHPDKNYGTFPQMRVDASPVVKSYLRFNVSGLSGTVTKAVLRLYANSRLSVGYNVYSVDNNAWSESTLNFSNAPSMGAQLGSAGAITAGTWTSVDVTQYVKGSGTFSFGLRNPDSTALSLASRESTNKPQLIITTAAPTPTPTRVPATATPTATKLPPTATATATKVPATATPTAIMLLPTATPITVPSASVRLLCDGKVYDGYTTKPFVLDSTVDQDPTIQKVIRNCVFRNSKLPAITIRNAKNVLIEGSTFENIRTHVAGDDVHAINIPCPAGCTIDNITIRNSTFRYIGADGIQLGATSRNISHVYIENNEFVGTEDVGENGVDVKGVVGPVSITGNKVHGFRPCQSPTTSTPGTQDCSGSNGEGMVIHDGGSTLTSPYNVTLENNEVYDNVYGVVVASGAKNITVRGNQSHNNLQVGLLIKSVYSILVTGNTFSTNPRHIKVDSTPLSGGSCSINNNTFLGTGTALVLNSSLCN